MVAMAKVAATLTAQRSAAMDIAEVALAEAVDAGEPLPSCLPFSFPSLSLSSLLPGSSRELHRLGPTQTTGAGEQLLVD